jgi:tetratricopeptide (TPR) repeat protein
MAAPPAKTASEEAFHRAVHHYNLGEFETALSLFREAYDAAPLPPLLFNIAQCHRNLGNNKEAIFFFERYLEEHPSADNAEEIQVLLADLQERERAKRAVVAAPDAGTEDVALQPETHAPPAEDRSLVEEWWFWTALAAVTVVVAGGSALAVHAARSDGPPEDVIATFDFRAP